MKCQLTALLAHARPAMFYIPLVIHIIISLTRAKVMTVKFRTGAAQSLKFLVLAANRDDENAIIKFPDREPDSGHGE